MGTPYWKYAERFLVGDWGRGWREKFGASRRSSSGTSEVEIVFRDDPGLMCDVKTRSGKTTFAHHTILRRAETKYAQAPHSRLFLVTKNRGEDGACVVMDIGWFEELLALWLVHRLEE